MYLTSTPGNFIDFLNMEIFSSRRWRLHWPKQKSVVLLLNPNKLCMKNSIVVSLLGRSSCSSPSTKELHALTHQVWLTERPFPIPALTSIFHRALKQEKENNNNCQVGLGQGRGHEAVEAIEAVETEAKRILNIPV